MKKFIQFCLEQGYYSGKYFETSNMNVCVLPNGMKIQHFKNSYYRKVNGRLKVFTPKNKQHENGQ